ncbi:MAG: hypothetical protein K2X31_10685 [Sphingopyxis sp.]|nr:hypothetical protein [Sphingopyxis sp.]
MQLLRPDRGTISRNQFGWSIELQLEPFALPGHPDIRTKMLIDCITLPSEDIAQLAGQFLKFPKASEANAPEGSAYIGYHHHPVDLLALQFGPVRGDTVDVRLAVGIAFSFEGLGAGDGIEYGDTGGEFEATLTLIPAPGRH